MKEESELGKNCPDFYSQDTVPKALSSCGAMLEYFISLLIIWSIIEIEIQLLPTHLIAS